MKTMHTFENESVLVNPVQLTPGDVSEAAFKIYSTSDVNLYADANGVYYAQVEPKGKLEKQGTLADVEELLMSYAD